MDSHDAATQQQTLNIPSLVAFAVISFFAIRYFFFSTPASAPGAAGSTYPGRRRPVAPEKIDQVAGMFPQLGRREIEWDLVRNGGSVQATTEKVLRDGRLDEPPPSFRGQPAPASASNSTSRPAQRRAEAEQPKHTDLITRYNLSAKISQEQAAEAAEEEERQQQQQKGGWSTSKAERQALLKRRREEMVLAARRKMEERDRKGKDAA